MAVVCHYCNEPASSSDLPCSSCKSFYHHVCLFPASIISKSWTHINSPPPSYALAIFSSPNFTFTCPSCLLNNSSNTSTTFSSPLVTPTPIHRNNPPIRPPIPAQLRIPKLMELKTFPPSFITANIPSPFPYHKSYASAIISSSSPIPIKAPIVHHVPPNSTTPYTLHIPRKRQLNNIIRNNSLVIEHLKTSDMNTEFISSILIHMLLPKISISIVKFKHNNAIIQFYSKSFCDMFFSIFRSTKFNPRFSHLYIRNSLPYKTRLLGKILYHAYILKLTPIHTKPIFNTYTKSFELRLIYNYIDWSLPPITIPPTLLIHWESSYLKFKSSVPSFSNLSINTNSDPTPNNPSENSNSPYIPVISTPSIDLNNSTITNVPVVDSLKSNHISTPSLTKSA